MCASNPCPRELPKTQTTSPLAARFQRYSSRWSAIWAPRHRKPRLRRRQSGGIARHGGPTRRQRASCRAKPPPPPSWSAPAGPEGLSPVPMSGKSPATGAKGGPLPVQNSPCAPAFTACAVQNSPCSPEMAQFGTFCSHRESFVPFSPPGSRTGRILYRTRGGYRANRHNSTPGPTGAEGTGGSGGRWREWRPGGPGRGARGRRGQVQTNFAGNFRRSFFETAEKRCYSNEVISMLEQVTGELHATLMRERSVGQQAASRRRACPVSGRSVPS